MAIKDDERGVLIVLGLGIVLALFVALVIWAATGRREGAQPEERMPIGPTQAPEEPETGERKPTPPPEDEPDFPTTTVEQIDGAFTAKIPADWTVLLNFTTESGTGFGVSAGVSDQEYFEAGGPGVTIGVFAPDATLSGVDADTSRVQVALQTVEESSRVLDFCPIIVSLEESDFEAQEAAPKGAGVESTEWWGCPKEGIEISYGFQAADGSVVAVSVRAGNRDRTEGVLAEVLETLDLR